MGCGCSGGKKKSRFRNNLGGSASVDPANQFLIEENAKEDTIFAVARESLQVVLRGHSIVWKAGQGRSIPRDDYDALLAKGAPIWTP